MKLKRWLAGVLAAVLLVNVAQIPFDVSAEDTAVTKTLYVSAVGSDETGDGSETTPYATISKAEEVLEADTEADAGKIIISGSVDFTSATHTKMITITGDGASGTQLNLRQDLGVKSIAGPTTIDGMKLNTGSRYDRGIQTGSEELILGSEITITGSAHSYFLVGASDAAATSKTPTLTVNSMSKNGSYINIIQVGTGYNNWMKGAEITVNGGTLDQIDFNRQTQYAEDVNITISGGSVNTIKAANANSSYKGAFQIILNNGIRPTIDATISSNVNPTGGKWIMYGDTTEGALSTTETAGTFKVTEGMIAKATNNSTGDVYYSGANDYLVVPAGEYSVTYSADGYSNLRYVSATGDDSKDGKLPENAFLSIAKAEESLELAFQENEAEEGIIIISGSVDFTSATHTKMITITGDGANETQLNLRQDLKEKSIAGPTTIDGVKLNTGLAYDRGIQTGSEELILGSEITITGSAHSYFLVGINSGAANSKTPTLTINSMTKNGSYINIIQVGTSYNNWMKGAEITVNGGTLDQIDFNRQTQYSDDVNITISGGSVNTIKAANANSSYTGAFQIILNNGIRPTIDATISSNVNPTGGKWIMYGDTTEGALLTTETAGTFMVESELYAKATSITDETVVYYGVPGGTIMVPAGEYNVTYISELPDNIFEITLDGVSQGLFASGTEYTLPTPEKKDYEFLGWTDGTDTYAGGSVVTLNTNLALTSTWKTDKAVMYVSSEGDDTTGDGTEASPYATIAKAEEELDKVNANTREIVMLTNMTLTTAAHENMIVIRGNTGSEVLSASAAISVMGPTTFQNHKVASVFSPYSDGNEVIYDNVTGTSTGSGMIYIGPKNDDATSDDVVTINGIGSGQWSSPMFRIGAWNTSKTASGDINVVVNGGHLYQLLFVGDGEIFNGDVNIIMNGGTLYNPIRVAGAAGTAFNGALQVVMNDGTGNLNVADTLREVGAAKGSWFMYDDVNEAAYVNADYTQYKGCSLQTTDTPGTFKVVNESGLEAVYAIATNLDNPSVYYYSNGDAVLTVPAGEWVVTYTTERPAYYCTGSQVIFNETVENFQLSDITSSEYNGKLIVGWMNGETLVENGSTFEAGAELTAVYVDFDKANNFAIKDTEIRLGDDKTKAGLRYIINMNLDLYNQISGTEYGIIVIEADNVPIINCGDIVIGGSYNDKTPAKIVSKNVFAAYNDSLSYTLCLTDIAEADYSTEYMVRGYIKFIDQNGIERVAYTDFEQSSVKATVEKMLADETVSDSVKTTLETEYMPVLNEEKATLAASYTKATEADSFGAYTLSNGLNVREITIGEEDNNTTDDVTLVQLTDLHLNLLGSKDFNENRQTVLSFYRNREWQKNAATASNAERALEYADAVADQIIVTGDTIDSLSYGALDASKRLLWSKYPNIMSTTGNHEWVERGGVGKISETMTKDEAQQVLQSYSIHDVLYSSKVLNDNVMIIQMDNAYWTTSYGYVQSQYVSLAQDLQTAKEKGYTVLIFQHLALKCDETDLTFDANHAGTVKLAGDASSVNMGAGDSYVNISDATSVNYKVYELITSSSDVVKGIFCGHVHSSLDTTVGGIPQYILASNQYDGGYALKINIK